MTTYRFDTKPRDVLERYMRRDDVIQFLEDLSDAGWIIVRDDAIKLAQAHARQEATNDNKSTLPIAGTFG
jgi:bifunctional DNA-binding transcriptional regulator/antitoxin component of YhaV-PrlF toxin-antitoxin module